jgi:phage terminase small subunit
MNLTRKRTLSEQQTQFCEYLVKENKNPTEAARLAGYAVPKQSAYILTRNPTVMTALRLMRQTVYQTDMASLAANTLKEVMQDPDANPSAKVSAARTALELAGDLGKNAEDLANGKNLGEMTPEELGSLIDRWEGERSNLAKDVTTPQKDEEDQ